MTKYLILLILALSFQGCKNSRTVLLNVDSSVLKPNHWYVTPDSLLQYSNFTNTKNQFVVLKAGSTARLLINQPYFINFRGQYLVYPGERIFLSNDSTSEYPIFNIKKNKHRNTELTLLNTLNHQESPSRDAIYKLLNPSNPTPLSVKEIIELDKKAKSLLPQTTTELFNTFDTLTDSLIVRKKFRKIVRPSIPFLSLYHLSNFYSANADTLKAHNLYSTKYKELLPYLSYIDNIQILQKNSYLLEEIMSKGFKNFFNQIKTFDDIEQKIAALDQNFEGLVKEYLITKILCLSIKKNIQMPTAFFKKNMYACNKVYRNEIKDALKAKNNTANKITKIGTDGLFMMDEKITTISELLDKYKGKLILLDFWATWCGPCIQVHPEFVKLKSLYPSDSIAFINISIDSELSNWQQHFFKYNWDKENNYKIIDSKKSDFIKRYAINAVPRYILINKNGEVINDDAPIPGSPGLQELINRYL